METCRDCPNKYPWLGDSEGTGIAGRDNYNYQSQSKEPPPNEESESEADV